MNKVVLVAAILAAVFLCKPVQADELLASWYGPGFEGLPTASGDLYDSSLYTAASPHLPMGTVLYIEHEGRGAIVTVNDVGPFVEGRDLDLSGAAAESIGVVEEGISEVYVEILYMP